MPQEPTYSIADETFVLPDTITYPGGRGPLYFNAMLIRGKEPVLIDTGGPKSRVTMLEAIWNLVDPNDLRWIFITHDDRDHVGNLTEVLSAAPNAKVVMNWLMYAKMAPEFYFPLTRVHIANNGDTFDVGDRTLLAHRPPAYDSPTTRGLFDPTTGVYFSGDCFGGPVPHAAQDLSEVPPDIQQQNMLGFNAANHSWVQFVDPDKFNKEIARLAALDPKVIASNHAPAARGQTKRLLDILAMAPGLGDIYQEPTQEQILAWVEAHGPMAGM